MTHLTSEEFLKHFHTNLPAATPLALSRGKVGKEQVNSYDLLVNEIANTTQNGKVVLDIGCGDGYLIDKLNKYSTESELKMIGLDWHENEIDIAKEKLNGQAEFIVSDANNISEHVSNKSVDKVCSHLSLMLTKPIDKVLSEIHGSLRKGGTLVGIEISDASLTPGVSPLELKSAFENCLKRHLDISKANSDEFLHISNELRHSPIAEKGWKTLLEEAGFLNVKEEQLSIDLSGSVDEVWGALSLYYQPYRLCSTQKVRFEEDMKKVLNELADNEGTVSFQLECEWLEAEAS